MGFEPIVDSTGELVKMIIRAWAYDSDGFIPEYLSPTRHSKRGCTLC